MSSTYTEKADRSVARCLFGHVYTGTGSALGRAGALNRFAVTGPGNRTECPARAQTTGRGLCQRQVRKRATNGGGLPPRLQPSRFALGARSGPFRTARDRALAPRARLATPPGTFASL
jgi:hypothetical protein